MTYNVFGGTLNPTLLLLLLLLLLLVLLLTAQTHTTEWFTSLMIRCYGETVAHVM